MKKYVQIQSTRPIYVTSGLGLKNVTANNTNRENNYKVKPMWPKTTILLEEGQHLYPSIVASFKSVQALVISKVATIGNEVDEIPESEKPRMRELLKKLKPLIDKLQESKEEIKKPKKSKEVKEIVNVNE